MLLTTTGRSENTGMIWNARHTNADVWGTAPTRIESIKGWLLLKQVEGAVGEIHGRLLEPGWEIPIGDVPATSYLIKVIR
jgi:hypothetical protein